MWTGRLVIPFCKMLLMHLTTPLGQASRLWPHGLATRGKREDSGSETPFLTVKTTGETPVPQFCHGLPDGGTTTSWARLLFCFIPVSLLVSACDGHADHPEIRAVLDQQVEAWNRGDLDGYMAHYWRSDDLVFGSPKAKTRGWDAVLERYRSAYPTSAEMGSLSLDLGEIAKTGEDTAEVAGRFHLRRADRDRSGRFFLHLRRIDGTWAIVRDFTIGD
ncbi:MAG: DUF4440 domain-containing protein [Phycisphaerae bacterium]|nr:DUF4440 domain-containing protein [Phycisphaerae bacterium]